MSCHTHIIAYPVNFFNHLLKKGGEDLAQFRLTPKGVFFSGIKIENLSGVKVDLMAGKIPMVGIYVPLTEVDIELEEGDGSFEFPEILKNPR